MYRQKGYRWLKHWDFTVLDILCMEAAFVLAVVVRHGERGVGMEIYSHMAVIMLLLNICIVFFGESYKGILKRGRFGEFKRSFLHVSYVVGLTLIYLYLERESSAYSRAVLGLLWIFYFLFTYIGRLRLKHYLAKKGEQNQGNHSIFIITNSDRVNEVVTNIHENSFGELRIMGITVWDEKLTGQEICGFPVVADRETVLDYIKENWVDEVFISLPREMELLEELLKGCTEMGVTIHLKLADGVLQGMNQSVEKLGSYTVLTKSIRMASDRQTFFKRAMDIAGGFVGLLITGIVFLFVAPAIYIASPGPIFFSQTRVGKNGRLFKIYKFRSMYMDAEERKAELMAQNSIKDGMMFKMEDDPRIIKGIGHFIRKTSIDELPQFWNVLKGDMSLVGTRPPTLDEWKKYEYHHRKRMSIKPGITGMWQVSGRSNIKDFEEVVKLDTEYIMNWSIGLDLKILMRTVQVVLDGEGSA